MGFGDWTSETGRAAVTMAVDRTGDIRADVNVFLRCIKSSLGFVLLVLHMHRNALKKRICGAGGERDLVFTFLYISQNPAPIARAHS